MARTGFGRHSLVCPAEYSEEETYWKEAYLYPDFGFEKEPEKQKKAEHPSAAQAVASEAETTDEIASDNSDEQPKEENDSPISLLLMKASKKMREDERAAPQKVSETAAEKSVPQSQSATTEENPAAYIQPDVAKKESMQESVGAVAEEVSIQLVSIARSPIEEYFNSMRTGDLGNILGIPDPKLNSDLNLANMLEKQFEKTDPNNMLTADKKEEKDPFDSFVSTQTEELDTFLQTRNLNATPEEKDIATQEQLQQDLKEKEKISASVWPTPQNNSADAAQENIPSTDTQQDALVVPLQEDDPNDKTVETIMDGTFRVKNGENELPEPIKRVSASQPTATLPTIDPEKVITPSDPNPSSPVLKWIGLGIGVILLMAGILLNFFLSHEKQPVSAQPSAQELLPEQPVSPLAAKPITVAPQPAAKPIPAVAPAVIIKTPEEQAVEIVQNYVLDSNRGTVKNFLSQHYAAQLAAGYTEVWSAEPLHRNTYVVKYRLSKTRQEPIMYIFQVDTAKKKLTGALNNITLDLVGKIK